jgi:hypothetical protein
MHGKLYKAVLMALMVTLLAGSSLTQSHLNADRERLGLTRLAPLENCPPILAFTTVALGGFRGLIANLLWTRANDLQQDEKFFEMAQLANWITKLQPHFVTVWVHQAWNMAYNISVKFPNPADRWPWVERGIQLLRDEGLKYNPQEPLIYRELAWFFQHKMGANLDAAHMNYKNEWAKEMQAVLGWGRTNNWETILNPKTDDERARVKILREKYKMDPKRMKAVDDTYGPLEWRLPEAHAIYWADIGLEMSRRKGPDKNHDLITLRRVIYQSMQLAAVRGRLVKMVYAPNDTRVEFGPNLPLIPKANDAYEQMMKDDKDYAEAIKLAHRNFLKVAIHDLYVHNREADAETWFKYLNAQFPNYPDAKLSLLEFVEDKLKETVATGGRDKVKTVITGYLSSGLLNLANGENETYYADFKMAEKIYNYYEEKISRAETNRVTLGPLELIKEQVLKDVFAPPPQGFHPMLQAELRTALNLPADAYRTDPDKLVFPGPTDSGVTNGVNSATQSAPSTEPGKSPPTPPPKQ